MALIRPVPADVNRRFRRIYNRNLKARQVEELPAERGRRSAARRSSAARACYALLEFKGFVFTTKSAEAADAMAVALEAPVKPGDEVDLDGKWTDAVKLVVFTYSPPTALSGEQPGREDRRRGRRGRRGGSGN